MATLGAVLVLCAFSFAATGAVCLLLGCVPRFGKATTCAFSLVGRGAACACAALLLACAVLLAGCFLTGDASLQFVAENRSDAEGSLARLFHVAGLWSGRQGSLLFWALASSAVSAFLALRRRGALLRLDDVATAVSLLIVAFMTGVLAFADGYALFMPADSAALAVAAEAGTLGMNPMLEHWAMAIHPPLLFAGYAGCAVPFCYAVAAFVLGEAGDTWWLRSRRPLLLSWAALTAGIGLGALWAHEAIGWGGFWAWDSVENVSLVVWLLVCALLHVPPAARARGGSLPLACGVAAALGLSALVSRTGVVRSMHAYSSDASSVAFLVLVTLVPLLVGVAGLLLRRFGCVARAGSASRGKGGASASGFGERAAASRLEGRSAAVDSGDEAAASVPRGARVTSTLLRCDAGLAVATCLLAYFTMVPALPAWLPFGGTSVSPMAFQLGFYVVFVGLAMQGVARASLRRGKRRGSAGEETRVEAFDATVVDSSAPGSPVAGAAGAEPSRVPSLSEPPVPSARNVSGARVSAPLAHAGCALILAGFVAAPVFALAGWLALLVSQAAAFFAAAPRSALQ